MGRKSLENQHHLVSWIKVYKPKLEKRVGHSKSFYLNKALLGK